MKDKTDKELYDLLCENYYARDNGVFNDYDTVQREIDESDKEILQELCKRGYILTKEEYNAIDYHLTKSKLYDSGFVICQKEVVIEDYFYDEDNNKEYTLQEGMQIVYDSVMDTSDYPKEVIEGLKHAFKRFLDIDWSEE